MGINKVFLSGNLTKDGELRQTQGGSSILSLGLAVNERRKNPQTGEWDEVPNYFDCTIFGNRAIALSPYLTKGTKVSIEGRLRWSSWNDQTTGQKRSKVEVIIDEIEFMTSRGQQQSQPQMQQYAQRPPAAPQAPRYAPQQQYAPATQMAPQPAQQGIYSEDIPF